MIFDHCFYSSPALGIAYFWVSLNIFNQVEFHYMAGLQGWHLQAEMPNENHQNVTVARNKHH